MDGREEDVTSVVESEGAMEESGSGVEADGINRGEAPFAGSSAAILRQQTGKPSEVYSAAYEALGSWWRRSVGAASLGSSRLLLGEKTRRAGGVEWCARHCSHTSNQSHTDRDSGWRRLSVLMPICHLVHLRSCRASTATPPEVQTRAAVPVSTLDGWLACCRALSSVSQQACVRRHSCHPSSPS